MGCVTPSPLWLPSRESPFDIGKALGHATPATTGKIYTHLVDHTHEDTLLKVSDALK